MKIHLEYLFSCSHELEIRQYVLERARLEDQVRALQHELDRAAQSAADSIAKLEIFSATLRERDRQIAALRSAMEAASDPKNSEK